MRTTMDLDDRVLTQAKRRALDEGKSLKALIECALRQYLQPVAGTGRGRRRARLLRWDVSPYPGLDFADRDALYERMGGRS